MIKTDILIIGSGAAGMTSAIELSKEFDITLISKNTLVDSSTWYAQGGIAAVIDEKDSTEDHLRDTLIAGDGLCNVEAVRECVSKGKEAIDWLSDIGTSFTRDKSSIIIILHKKEVILKDGLYIPKMLQVKKSPVLLLKLYDQYQI